MLIYQYFSVKPESNINRFMLYQLVKVIKVTLKERKSYIQKDEKSANWHKIHLF